MALRDELPAGMLDDVKNYLDITWTDDATDKKVGGLIASGMMYLRIKLGGEVDFCVDGLPRSLLFDHVRYARDGALDIFENNYRTLIITAINERRVKAYAETAEQTDQ